MTVFSFRLDDNEAIVAQHWADDLGIDISDLLRDALHRHLVHLASEVDTDSWAEVPHTADELSLGAIAEWGPADDWSEWADAAR